MAVLADGRLGAHGWTERSLPHLFSGKNSIRHRRYTNETNRLYGVLNKRLADRAFVAGDYSIADMASYPWVVAYDRHGQKLEDFPHLKRWFEAIRERPATKRAWAKAKEVNPNFGQPAIRTDEERKILFGQTAAVVKA
jgi:GST-like protein